MNIKVPKKGEPRLRLAMPGGDIVVMPNTFV